ncbi:phage distal tail protein [Streptomyces vastus]|uniref:Siphovirus-type tail component C-terminal domain-containing protein n=1 Tax=Streptomyces vastus TaxID=285451 RepID=A0ABN3RN46_9ACTN
MAELGDWQIEIAGVLIGAGTDVPVSEVEGLGIPEFRTQDVDNPAGDGAFPGIDLYAARTIRIEAGIRTAGNLAAALDVLGRLQRAADDPAVRTDSSAQTVLRLRWPGRTTRRLYGRLRRVEATSTAKVLHGWIPLDLEFAALDPRFHADDASALTLTLSSDGLGGFRAPLVAPLTTGVAIPDERRGWVRNDGDLPAWPSLRITGPCTNPRIQHVESDRVIELALALQSGEYVEIETRPGTRWALRNGTGNLAPALSPASRLDTFVIPPGTSEIWWTARDYTNSTRLAVTWRAAYAAL